jgi:hypothetical protein
LIDYERKTTFVMQPHLINNLKEKIEKEPNNLSDYGTPGTPRFKIVRPTDKTEKIDGNIQSKYCSGVGILLYLIKYSRPDLANVIRELSKCMDGANLAAYKDMLRVLKFVLDKKDYCLKLKQKQEITNKSNQKENKSQIPYEYMLKCCLSSEQILRSTMIKSRST